MAKVTKPTDHLEKQLNKLEQLQFQTYIQETLQQLLTTYCPNQNVVAKVFPLDEDDTFGREKLGGVSAFIDYHGTLTFVVYPDEKVRSTLESTITHEFHHFWRMGHLGITEENETLLDRLVLEGLAEYFVGETLGYGRQGPFNKALSEQQAKELWFSKYRGQLELKGEATNRWIFGGENELPLWAGYSMGYHLVHWYHHQHPEHNIETLSLLPSEAFIRI